MSDFDPAPAAALLADAWRRGAQLHALPDELRPQTMAEGYALQDALIAAMGAATDDVPGGWKLGVGSPLALRQTGLGRPLIGRLLASRCHASGAHVEVPGGAPITLEFEVAFVLACEVPPDAPIVSPLDLVAAAHVSFELVRSRFVDRRSVGWPSFAGDSVGFEALVVGPAIDAAQIDAITREVVVTLDDTERAHGLSGDALTDPAASFAALLVHARERGITLARGAIVSTGAIAAPFDFVPTRDRDIHLAAHFPGGDLQVQVRARS